MKAFELPLESPPESLPQGAACIDGLLHEKYGQDPWFYFSQVPERADGMGRTIDGLAVNVWNSKFAVIAFEIKVSRSDFLSELRDPSKRQPFIERSTQFYFVTPHGLVQPDEVPAECGLMWVQAGGRIITKKAAQQRTLKTVPAQFLAAVVRKAGQGQAYKGRKLFKFAGRDLTHAEFVEKSKRVITEHIESSELRRKLRAEVKEEYERKNRHRLALADWVLDKGNEVGMPRMWYVTESKVAAKMEDWYRSVVENGLSPDAVARLRRFADALENVQEVLEPFVDEAH